MIKDYFNVKYVGSARELKDLFGFKKDEKMSNASNRYYYRKVGNYGGKLMVVRPSGKVIYHRVLGKHDPGVRASCGRIGIIKRMVYEGHLVDDE